MTRKSALFILGGLLLATLVVGANFWNRREVGITVTTERLQTRDLEATVSASGKIQPKRQVSISANTMGRVTRVAVQEGQFVKAGQFLLEIDPRSLAGQLQRGEAGVGAAQSALQQARTSVDQARANLDLAKQNLKRQDDLWKDGLTTRESLERAQNEVSVRESDLKARQQDIQTRDLQIKQEQAQLDTTRYNLTQVIISSPMDGLVTRRNIEEGETAIVGTMNNAGSQLLTIADMSVVEAEIEVDETDIPAVALGQPATVTIDAVAGKTFNGRVTEIGNSPIQTNAGNAAQRQATTFKVVITLDQQVPDVRPGFTCTAEITTAKRTNVLAVPIQALTIREMRYNATGEILRAPTTRRARRAKTDAPTAVELGPGETKKETEGVFLLQDSRAVFTPVKTGVAGERYFELLSGAKTGDQIITGPFASVRELADGTTVKANSPRPATTPTR